MKKLKEQNAIFAIDKLLIKIVNNKRNYPDFKNKHSNISMLHGGIDDATFWNTRYDKNGCWYNVLF